MNRIKELLRLIGVNQAVGYSLAGKILSCLTTPITLCFIAKFLSPSEQGYYYTFYSLLGVSIFFELGLGVVITQFASHEYSGLSWSDFGELQGSPVALSRVISLIRKSIKWYAIIAGLLVVILLPGGWIFLGSKPESVATAYILPWILLVIFFGLNICFVPILAAMEGCGQIAQVQQLRLMQVLCGVMCAWIFFIAGGKLMTIPAEFMAYWGVILVWLSIRYRGFMGQVCIYPVQRQMQISWLKEVFPMQWKIAVSSIAAYFTSYLFVPLLFVWRGAVEAGKMGMSLKLSSLVFTVSIAWISSRAPLYGAFIQKKQYKELDKLAFRCSKQAVLVSLVITVAVVLVLTILAGYFPKYRDRALSWWVVGILCLANVICVVNSAIGGYLRANKEEPLMVITLIVAAFSAVMSFVATKYYDANYLSVGYFLIMLCIGLPGFFWILRTKLKERHGQ